MPSREKGYITIRPPKDVHDSLAAYSDKLDLSINWLVNQAIKEFLAKLPPVEEIELKLTKE